MSNDLEHGSDDPVGSVSKLKCRGWTEEWWRWILRREEKKNPLLIPDEPATLDWYRAGQPTQIQNDNLGVEPNESVWFLAASPYGGGTARVHIPRGKWSILAAPYIAGASQELYPSLDLQGCKDLVDEDVDGVEAWYASLDGKMLSGCEIKSGPFLVDGIPISNPFGILPKQQGDSTIRMDMVQYGYWVFLKPLDPGDHLLHLYGKSTKYYLDVTYQLLVAGPPKKSH